MLTILHMETGRLSSSLWSVSSILCVTQMTFGQMFLYQKMGRREERGFMVGVKGFYSIIPWFNDHSTNFYVENGQQ
jgi:hypothetical protein